MHFMRLVTVATKAQYDAIAAESDVMAAIALRQYAIAIRRDVYYADPRIGFTEAIGKSLDQHATPGQATRYRNEIELRYAARKKAIVLNLVSMIDRTLLLQADQREKLTQILADNWHDSWNQTQILVNGSRCMPLMPDDKINPILTVKQREVWSAIPKNRVRFGPNLDFNRDFEFEDEVWEDEPREKNVETPVSPKVKP
jgi:hypothetical protein